MHSNEAGDYSKGPEFVDALNKQFKQPQPGCPLYRAIHAKGLCCRGRFIPNDSAAEVTTAQHLAGEAIDVVARFSNGDGDPGQHDGEAFSRGFAVQFELADGRRTDLLSIISPTFLTNDPNQFLEFVEASGARFPTVSVGKFMVTNPLMAARVIRHTKTQVPASVATTRWHSVNAFQMTNASGEIVHARYIWVPIERENMIERDEAEKLTRSYLMEDGRQRLVGESNIEFDLHLRLAKDGDVKVRDDGKLRDDVTEEWDEDGRRTLVVGRLVLDALDEKGDAMSYDPTRVVDGIACLDHPIIWARSAVYAESARRRLEENIEGAEEHDHHADIYHGKGTGYSMWLPFDDPKPDKRQKGLEANQAKYDYSYEYPPGVALAKIHLTDGLGKLVSKVSEKAGDLAWKDDYYSIPYIAKALALDQVISRNIQASKMEKLKSEMGTLGDLAASQNIMDAYKNRGMKGFTETFMAQSYQMAESFKHVRLDPADYEALFATIDKTPIIPHHGYTQRQHDLAFAWQRLAGVNPMILRRVDALQDNFPVTDAIFKKVLPNDSLDVAAKEGRLFVADYQMLDGLKNGTLTLAQIDTQIKENKVASVPDRGSDADTIIQKYLYAPIALFALPKWSGVYGRSHRLVPVAVQCGQDPSRAPIWTPHDGWRWKMACMTVQIADGNHHQTVTHLGRTHMAIEAFIISAKRQLSTRHPLYVLLEPHFQFTLAINNTAAHNLIAPGGEVDQVLGCSLDESIGLTGRCLKDFDLDAWLPGNDIKARGLDDPELLPDFPYRDDAMLVWGAIRDWVKSYIEIFYHCGDDVIKDKEIQAFVGEVATTKEDSETVGGRLPGVGKVETVERLVDLVSFLIFSASAQHAAVNFSQFPYMGYLPNLQGAGFAPAPTDETPNTRESWSAMLAPLGMAILQFNVAYQLSSIRMGLLGDYSKGKSSVPHFRDPRVQPLVQAFKKRLAEIEVEIEARDKLRLISYPWLKPSLITESIHI